MNKHLLSAMLISTACLCSLPTFGEVKYGIKGGINMNNLNLDNAGSNFSAKNKTGYYIGGTCDFHLYKKWTMDISLLFDNREVSCSYKKKSYENGVQYLSLPISCDYNVNFCKNVDLYLTTGPQFSYCISGDNSKIELDKSIYSWNVGGGFKILRHIELNYNYNIGIGDFGVFTPISKAAGHKLKNNIHQIGLTYIF